MNYCDPINWHEAANLFPILSGQELQELAADIKENGLINPVVLLDEKVLDGRNRLLACKKSEVSPVFTHFVQNGVSPVQLVISMNLKRRHLSNGQRAAVAVEAKPLLASEAKKNQKLGGYSERFLKNVKPLVSEPVHVDKEIAKQFDVSQGYVYAAQKIKDKDDKVFQKVKSGELSIPEANKELGFKQSTKAMVSSDSNEWYTPEYYIKAAKLVLGSIDLDPASCEVANRVVNAKNFYTQEDDGLTQKWFGKIWLNPPYGDIGPKFVAKVIEQFESSKIEEAILLVNSHCTDSKWFKPLFNHTLCFTDHRSKFWNNEGIGSAPTHGSVFVYLGDSSIKFYENFKQFGSIVESYKKESNGRT